VKRRALFLSLSLLLAALAVTLTLAKDKKHRSASGMDERRRAMHTLNRLTFGPRPGDVDRVMAIGVDRWIDEQLHPEHINDSALDARLSSFRTLRMSTQQMVEEFPPQPVIRAVAEGKMEMPHDPMRRAIYEAQLEKFRNKQNKQDTAQNDAQADDQMRRQARQAAQEQAQSILGLPPEQRFEAIMQMDPESRERVAAALAPRQQISAMDGFTPQQRETVLAMVNPQQVVDGELRQGKLLRAIYSERQLQEVMTDFWFNHFNVFLGKGADRYMVTSYERDVIRPNAMGKFKNLLLATAKSPAMMFYLDNWMSVGPESDFALYGPGRRPQPVLMPRPRARGVWVRVPRPQPPPRQAKAKNKRSGINENYARELMELHTLGVNGGYTQKDVTEVARVFTGWTLEEPRKGGTFTFNERMHEPGEKHVLGHRIKQHGEEEGKQVIELLARNPATAHFVCSKLAQRFVSDDPPAPLVERMQQTFLRKDGDIREVLRTMFKSPEFWSADDYRAKVKTPLEFVASSIRASGADVEDATPLVQALNRMGMPLYGAQPPTGYSTRADVWVNSAALLDRMNFALGLATGRIPYVTLDASRLTATGVSTIPISQPAMPEDSDRTLAALEQVILGGELSKTTHETVLAQMNSEQAKQRPANVAVMTGLLLGSPEFQRH
jgi:uncharacterized protein (DUF1800 family)